MGSPGEWVVFWVALAAGAGLGWGEEPRDWEAEARILIQNFTVAEGLRVELFADSSQVKNPSAICFDEQGDLYVAEIHRWRAGVEDIRHHPSLLVEDLRNGRTEDRLAMYRGAAERGYLGMETWTRFADRVRRVRDTDGNGRADRSAVFADGFDDPLDGPGTGLLAGKGGLYYTNIPHLWWLEDADGDGVSEGRRSLQDGFGVRMSFSGHDLHGLTWGPDGRIYWSIGDRGYSFQTPEGVELRDPVAGAVFRCEPDGSRVERIYTGLRNPQELAFDQYGNLFTCDNDADAWDEGRLVYVLEGGDSGWHAGHQVLLNFRETLGLRTPVREDARDGKWRALTAWLAEGLCLPAREGQPAWVLPPVENVSWGPSGLVYNYGGTALPAEYRDTFFVCNFGGAKGDLEAFSVERNGAGFAMREWKKAWMVGAGNTDVEFGPDGKLYLSCFNNHGWEKQDIGTIYTLHDPALADSLLVRETRDLLREPLPGKSGAELADWLSHEDLRVRLRAQFELARRGEESLAYFEGSVNQTTRLLRRLHGIWGIGQVARSTGSGRAVRGLVAAAADPEAEVRAQAAKALGDVADGRAGMVLVRLLGDESPRVRCFACLAIARRGQKEGWEGVLRVLEENADADRFLRHAAVAGLTALGSEEDLANLAGHASAAVRRGAVVALRRQRAAELRNFLGDADPAIVREAVRAIHDLNVTDALPEVARLLESVEPAGMEEDGAWLHQMRLINANWRLGTEESAKRLAAFASRGEHPGGLRIDALRALEEWTRETPVDPVVGLARPLDLEGRPDVSRVVREAVARMASETQGELLATVLRLARQVRLEIEPAVLRSLLGNGEEAAAVRLEALEDLARRKPGDLKDLLKSLVADKDSRVRGAAVRALLRLDPPLGVESAIILLDTGEVTDKQQALLGLAEAGGVRVRKRLEEMLDEAASGRGEGAILLELLEAAEKMRELGPGRDRYLASLDPADRWDEFRECLEGGDVGRGAALYANHPAAQCNKCHKIGESGGIAGPELTGIGQRQDARYLLESLLDPSAVVVPGYGVTLVTKTDGTTLGGSLVAETESAVVLRMGDTGVAREIRKEDIAQRTAAVSAMPPMGPVLSKRELRDLVAYLAAQKGQGSKAH